MVGGGWGWGGAHTWIGGASHTKGTLTRNIVDNPQLCFHYILTFGAFSIQNYIDVNMNYSFMVYTDSLAGTDLLVV